MKIKILMVILILLFTSLACSFNVNIPKVTTSTEMVFTINEAVPQDRESSGLEIGMGAGKLNISGGADGWVSGEVKYNVSLWDPEIFRTNNGIRISQTIKNQIGIPNNKVINAWNIQLGNHPTDLEINAGAYQGNLNLSGIPLTKLKISDGASQGNIRFDTLNPVEMSLFQYSSGASEIEIYGLANANSDTFIFEAGPGSYTLDFSGELKKDMDIEIDFGMGDVKIIVPKGVPAYVIVDGGLNNVELRGTWNVSGNEYSLSGSGPQLNFDVNMGIGNLQLINR
ncbi:MAG: toast rack family protein [Anaerolineaceae bacterium]|jgi:hypothetical protein|nr:toast rack family protein [Anaerolineaceae bacterium]